MAARVQLVPVVLDQTDISRHQTKPIGLQDPSERCPTRLCMTPNGTRCPLAAPILRLIWDPLRSNWSKSVFDWDPVEVNSEPLTTGTHMPLARTSCITTGFRGSSFPGNWDTLHPKWSPLASGGTHRSPTRNRLTSSWSQ